MERMEMAGSRTTFGLAMPRGTVRRRAAARALTLFTYAAVGWATLVGGLFLVTSVL